MKGRSAIILVLVAALLVGIAVLSQKKEQQRESSGIVAGKLLLPDLPVNDVEKIVIKSADGSATMERIDDTWVSHDKFKYPANFNKIKEAVVKLSEVKISQQVTATDAQKEKMNMLMPSQTATNKSGMGTAVELLGAAGKKIASLLVGGARERKSEPGGYGYPDGQYVSTDGGATIYMLAENMNNLSANSRDWVEAEIFNVPLADISEVSITGPDRPAIKLARKPGETTYTLEGLAADEELEISKVNSIEGALGYMRFTDIADPALNDMMTGIDKAVIYQATTKSGEVYTARIGSTISTNSRDRYVKFTVDLKPQPPAPPVPAGTNAVAGSATNAPGVMSKEDRQKLEEKVKTLNAAISKWTFIVETYKHEPLTVPRMDLVKKKAPPAEPKKEEGKADQKKTDVKQPEKTEQPAAAPAAAVDGQSATNQPPAEKKKASGIRRLFSWLLD